MSVEIHHVSVIVAEINKALCFYCDILGLQVDHSRPDLGYPGAWLTVATQQIHLMQLANPDENSQRPEHGGRDRHLALKVSDFSELKNTLDKHKISYTLSKSGRQALFCRDYDMNVIEIVGNT